MAQSRKDKRASQRPWEEVKTETGAFLLLGAPSMESAFTNGWYAYKAKSRHTLDAPDYKKQEIGSACFVKFGRTLNTGIPNVLVRFCMVETPKELPPDPQVAMTDEYSRIYAVRRYLWFFPEIEDEALTRKYYEGQSLGGRPITRKMVAY